MKTYSLAEPGPHTKSGDSGSSRRENSDVEEGGGVNRGTSGNETRGGGSDSYPFETLY